MHWRILKDTLFTRSFNGIVSSVLFLFSFAWSAYKREGKKNVCPSKGHSWQNPWGNKDYQSFLWLYNRHENKKNNKSMMIRTAGIVIFMTESDVEKIFEHILNIRMDW